MDRFKVILGCLPLFIVTGCATSSAMSPNEQADFEKSINVGKEKLDPETLPPEVRDRVKGFMKSNGPPAAGG